MQGPPRFAFEAFNHASKIAIHTLNDYVNLVTSPRNMETLRKLLKIHGGKIFSHGVQYIALCFFKW